MSSTVDQARIGATLDAQEDAASRTFAHEPGEGEALWWIGMLATIKATAEETGGQYTLVEVLAPKASRVRCTSTTPRTKASTSSKAR